MTSDQCEEAQKFSFKRNESGTTSTATNNNSDEFIYYLRLDYYLSLSKLYNLIVIYMFIYTVISSLSIYLCIISIYNY